MIRKSHLSLGNNGFIYANYETACYDKNAIVPKECNNPRNSYS